MDFSSFPAFEAARSVAGDERENRVAASLQLRKAEHESNVLGPALGGSLVLLGAAWFAHAFWPMLAVVGFRFVTDLVTQYNSRAIIVSLAANEDPRELTRRSHIIALFSGAASGMSIWPIQEVELVGMGAVLVNITVHISAIIVMIMNVASLECLRRWLAGWLIAMAAPALVGFGATQALLALTSVVFAGALLWFARRLHLQLRQMIELQFDNEDLASELGELNAALTHSLALAERTARCDGLTGLPNRRAFEEAIVKLNQDSGTVGRHLLLIDLDHFKSINDRFGHATGDVVLASVSAAIEGQMRAGECCARWGGEEFVALLLDCNVDAALARVESLRRQIGAMIVPGLPSAALPVTASIGIAPWNEHESLESVVARADEAMCQAKYHGRNRAFYAGLFAGPGLSYDLVPT